MARGLIPRPGIVAKLAGVSLILLTIPILTLRYLEEMQDFVLSGQRDALQLAAQAVATVLHGREDLFSESGGLPFSPWDQHGCSPLPFEAPVQLDGNGRDWPREADHLCRYQRARSAWGDAGPTVGLDLTLGQRADYLYVLFEVYDDVVRYRDRHHRNLDGSDHIRITVPTAAGDERHYAITAEEPGAVTAYEVGETWRYALGDGLPVFRIQGAWRESRHGYTVEMRIPLALLPVKQIGFAIADVDTGPGAAPSVLAAGPPGAPGRIQLVLLESPETLRILRGLTLPEATISVIDERRRVRSEVGGLPDAGGGPHRERLIDVALEAGVGASESGPATTAASSPIRVGARIVGAVLIEQANGRILALPRRALLRERNAMLVLCVAIAGIFWAFAWRIAWRIHRLRDEAGDAIDPDGRVKSVALRAGRRAGDEIGDLSRTISRLLGRLAGYTSFLERIPSILRHELSNPLNTLSTSLENLATERPDVADSKYLRSAERGVARLTEIVESLTEAASLEEALRQDELESIDLAALVQGYVENFASCCPERRFAVRGADQSIPIVASDFRLEQLLDKLVDNAVAYSPEDSEIELRLTVAGDRVRLQVSNDVPRDRPASPAAAGPHLGIGLYVVRLIAEHLGGNALAIPREGRCGVTFRVELPVSLAQRASRRNK